MKITLLTVAVAALVTLSGCGTGTSGGPGGGKGGFKLSTPPLGTTLKQDESKGSTIGISREKNFDQDVTLKFEDLPKGLTIEPATPAIKHGDSEAKVTIKAAADAALGDFTVKVIGHPTKGTDAETPMKITVKKK